MWRKWAVARITQKAVEFCSHCGPLSLIKKNKTFNELLYMKLIEFRGKTII